MSVINSDEEIKIWRGVLKRVYWENNKLMIRKREEEEDEKTHQEGDNE